jgi:hypothetical protein
MCIHICMVCGHRRYQRAPCMHTPIPYERVSADMSVRVPSICHLETDIWIYGRRDARGLLCQMIAAVDIISGAVGDGSPSSHWAEEAWEDPAGREDLPPKPRLMRRRLKSIATAGTFMPARSLEDANDIVGTTTRRNAASATVVVS